MSVSNVVPIRRLPWGGGTGLGRPDGMWVGVATALGDGSGGIIEAQLQFQAAASPLQALLYHLGQCFVVKSGIASAEAFQLKTQLMGWGPEVFSWQVNMNMLSLTAASGLTEVAAPYNQLPKNILLGTPLADASDPAVLEAINRNVTGDNLTLAAMGYVWSQVALAQPGAPRLPEGNLWG